MRKKLFLLCWIIVLLCRGLIFAQELEKERKELQALFITERASSQQDKGEWQFRGDFEYRRDDAIELDQYRISGNLEYGLFDWLELEAALPYVWQELDGENTDSIGNLNTGITFLLLRGGLEIPYIGAGLEVGFPTAEEDQEIEDEEEKYTYEGFLNLTKNFEPFIIDLNLAYSQSRNGEKEEELEYNLGLDLLLDRVTRNDSLIGWHLIAEFNGETNLTEDINKSYITPGIKYMTSYNLELGLGAPIGLVDEADDYRIIVSGIYEWGGEE